MMISVEALMNPKILNSNIVSQQEATTVLAHAQFNLEKFKGLIETLETSRVTKEFTRGLFIACQKLPTTFFKAKDGSGFLDEVRAAQFACGIFALAAIHPNLVPEIDVNELESNYPSLSKVSQVEKVFLANHVRYTKIGLYLKRAEKNKKYFLSACTKLAESPTKHYITGSGQKPETQRRVDIFEQETGVKPVSRSDRTLKAFEPKTCSKESRPMKKESKKRRRDVDDTDSESVSDLSYDSLDSYNNFNCSSSSGYSSEEDIPMLFDLDQLNSSMHHAPDDDDDACAKRQCSVRMNDVSDTKHCISTESMLQLAVSSEANELDAVWGLMQQELLAESDDDLALWLK